MKQNFLHAALGYLENGFFVFPLRPRSKAPLTPNGFKDASNDPAQIEAWWRQHPNANIGIATGKISGLLVLDVDGTYPEHWPQLPVTLKVKTHKGWHFYFKYPKGHEIGCRVKIDGLPVDVRADGGYIVAPPSEHPEGGHYAFVNE
ncbi:MAG: bifunctional DNA primase/polymerase [Proteobacteria bacterium]|nr:bifunctional DNA primase/polymerase [Pseudomonadota bacterium]